VTFPELCGTAACPLQSSRPAALEWPVGQVRRVAAPPAEVDETKRNILKLAAVAGVIGIGAGGAIGGAIQYLQPPVVGLSSFPKVQLLDVDGAPLRVENFVTEYTVETAQLLLFYYPLTNEPNFLLNLGPVSSGGLRTSRGGSVRPTRSSRTARSASTSGAPRLPCRTTLRAIRAPRTSTGSTSTSTASATVRRTT